MKEDWVMYLVVESREHRIARKQLQKMELYTFDIKMTVNCTRHIIVNTVNVERHGRIVEN